MTGGSDEKELSHKRKLKGGCQGRTGRLRLIGRRFINIYPCLFRK